MNGCYYESYTLYDKNDEKKYYFTNIQECNNFINNNNFIISYFERYSKNWIYIYFENGYKLEIK